MTRVTVGFRDDDSSWSLLTRVGEICRRVSARLRVVTFVVAPPRRPVTARVSQSETQVIQQWMAQVVQAQQEAEAHLMSQGFSEEELEFSIADGADWAAAIDSLDWTDGDVLVVGSSSTLPMARVFLGSSATKIIRYAPVPVIAVPGKAAG